MKRKVIAGMLSALVMLLLLGGCGGIPQEDYDAVLAERDALQSQVASLESDLTAAQSDLTALQVRVAELEAAALSFSAATHVNTEYGFSISYPDDWDEMIVAEPVAFTAGSGSWFTPGAQVWVEETAEPFEAMPAIVLMDPNLEIIWQRDTTLADGTPAFESKTNSLYWDMDTISFNLGVYKDGAWYMVTVYTIESFMPWDEALMSEIAHTFQFL